MRQTIFRKDADYEAFLRVLTDGREKYSIDIFSFSLIPSYSHFILRPNPDGQMGRLLRWGTSTHTLRYHAHDHTRGAGHLYQARFKSFPIQDDAHFYLACPYVERNPLRAGLVKSANDLRFGSFWR